MYKHYLNIHSSWAVFLIFFNFRKDCFQSIFGKYIFPKLYNWLSFWCKSTWVRFQSILHFKLRHLSIEISFIHQNMSEGANWNQFHFHSSSPPLHLHSPDYFTTCKQFWIHFRKCISIRVSNKITLSRYSGINERIDVNVFKEMAWIVTYLITSISDVYFIF